MILITSVRLIGRAGKKHDMKLYNLVNDRCTLTSSLPQDTRMTLQ